MKKTIEEIIHSDSGYLVKVKYTPHWIEKLFGVEEKEEQFYSKYGIMWFDNNLIKLNVMSSLKRMLEYETYDKKEREEASRMIDELKQKA